MSEQELRDLTCHRLLLSLAGRLPDDLLRTARRALADGEIRTAVSVTLEAIADRGLAVTQDELDRARQLTEDSEGFERLNVDVGFLTVDQVPEPAYEFASYGPAGTTSADAVDEAVVLAAEASAERIAAVWRCWRRSLFGEEADRRVYLVQAELPDDAPALAGTFYDALASAGERDAGVEVVPVEEPLFGYQRLALDRALLLWASGDPAEPEFHLARVFDHADPVLGPGFHPDHPLITEVTERDRLLDYLASGYPVLSTTSRMPDPLDPTAGEAVPLGFLTDGEWIWTEGVGYFLERHHLAPDAALLAHIRKSDFEFAEVDADVISRATAFVLGPSPEEDSAPVWPAGAS
ncbi:hypothetical protein KNE206_57150 [Kitasatospora sp. NE20-6]|uniref:hypothetical protein n=1 Tax=Kitasatospora sp. NE20-6 TaxID=2859066 RepID=UPI0034DC44C6